jgi:hypothetical protein
MIERRASCSCGQLSIRCQADPVRISICHCFDCQRRTGSVLAVQARFPREQVAVDGRASDYVRVGDSGSRATFHFCPVCSSVVYYELESVPGFVGVPVGGFADPGFPPPTVQVYEVRRHPWLDLSRLDVEHD